MFFSRYQTMFIFKLFFSQFMGLWTLGLIFSIFSGNYQQKEKEGMREIYIYIYIYIYISYMYYIYVRVGMALAFSADFLYMFSPWKCSLLNTILSVDQVPVSDLISLQRYQTKWVFKFLFSQLMTWQPLQSSFIIFSSIGQQK